MIQNYWGYHNYVLYLLADDSELLMASFINIYLDHKPRMNLFATLEEITSYLNALVL